MIIYFAFLVIIHDPIPYMLTQLCHPYSNTNTE